MSDSQIQVVPLPYDDLTLNERQFIALMWKVSGFFSIWGSCYILFDIFGSSKNRNEKIPLIYYRIMAATSFFDLLASIFASILSTTPIPSDSPNSDVVWGNIGTTKTCDAQAVMVQFSAIGAMFYSTVLALYFWLFISCSWNEAKLRKIEPYLHVFVLLFCILSSAILYAEQVTNHGVLFCWINSVPINCDKDENVECVRGENVLFYRTIFMITPIVVCFLLINFFMISLYFTFRRQASRMRRYSHTQGSIERRSSLNRGSENEGRLSNLRNSVSNSIRRSSNTSISDQGPMMVRKRKVFFKAMYFIGAFFVVWSPVALISIMVQLSSKTLFWIFALESVITPLIGFFNALIYENASPLTFFERSFTRLRERLFSKNWAQVNSDYSELILFSENTSGIEMDEEEVTSRIKSAAEKFNKPNDCA